MALELKVESDIRIPEKGSQSKKYPFREMKVGDCFAIPLTELKLCSELSAAAFQYGSRNGVKFTTRTDRSAGVRRCWRIE